jgi:hypothetical protein
MKGKELFRRFCSDTSNRSTATWDIGTDMQLFVDGFPLCLFLLVRIESTWLVRGQGIAACVIGYRIALWAADFPFRHTT